MTCDVCKNNDPGATYYTRSLGSGITFIKCNRCNSTSTEGWHESSTDRPLGS